MSDPKTEAEWAADSDARTLVEAEAIKVDEKRFTAAQARAKELVDEQEAKAKAMRRIAEAKMIYSVEPATK